MSSDKKEYFVDPNGLVSVPPPIPRTDHVNDNTFLRTMNTLDQIAPTISFGAAANVSVGGVPFTRTLTTNSAGAVTYSSSNAGVVSVNASTGLVTIVGAGSTTITANQCPSGNYSACSATFTVNVSEDPISIVPILPIITTSDNGGALPIAPINAGGVIDPLGRTINYSAVGLPSGLNINSSTGIISGMHDALGNESFNITVKATPTGGSNSLMRSFILTIVDNG